MLFLCKKRNIEDLQTTQVVVQEERERERAGKTDPSFFIPPFLCRRTLDAASLKEEREGRKKSIIFVGRKRGSPWCIIGRRREEEEEGVDRRRGPDDCWKERPEGGEGRDGFGHRYN